MNKHGVEKNAQRREHGPGKRLLAKALGVTMVPVAALALLATPAEARQECRHTSSYNICLTITKINNDRYQVTLGLDYRAATLSQAQAMLNRPVVGWLYGADWIDDQLIVFTNAQASKGASQESGYSVEWTRFANRELLDEDDDNRDELFGRIDMPRPTGSGTIRLETPEYWGNFL